MPTKPDKIDPMTGRTAKFILSARDNRGIPGEFDYYRSGSHVFIGEVPADLGRHYADGYQEIPRTEADLAALAKGDAYRLDPILERVPRGKYLEIGPWIGLVTYTAYRAGYDVSVFERSTECCELLSRVSNGAIKTFQTEDPAEELGRHNTTYDVIALWHVIEHLPRPWDVIEAAARALNPGGVLLIAAPNPESAQFKALGKRWLHLDAPRHLHLVPVRTYEHIGQRNGLQTVVCTTDDKLGRILDGNGWRYEMNRRFSDIPVVRKILRFPLHSIAARLLRRKSRLDGAGFTLIMQRPLA